MLRFHRNSEVYNTCLVKACIENTRVCSLRRVGVNTKLRYAFVAYVYCNSSLCAFVDYIDIYDSNTEYQSLLSTKNHSEPRLLIGVIGTGYVGLVTGAGLAECGNIVICADIDTTKIALLQQGVIPIYEPGLQELVTRNVAQKRLSFSTDVTQTLHDTDIIIISIGTPELEDGSVDLQALDTVIGIISTTIHKHTTIIIKSTVPVGTGKRIRHILEKVYGISPTLFSIVSNPEFLREGSAVQDFLNPDRLVIGLESTEAEHIIRRMYQPLLAAGVPCVYTNIPTAEMIKYASNAFLGVKLGFINEI
jgi:UDPglucose 6-dehydrogenase